MARGQKRGIFYEPPYHPTYAQKVTFQSKTAARKAASELVKEAKEAKRPSKIRRILRVLTLASVRAKAGSKNPKFSKKTKEKWKAISEIYGNAAKRVKKIYEKRKK